MNLITRGFGEGSSLISVGFGYSIEVVTPEVTVRTSNYGGGFKEDLYDTINKAIIQTKHRTVDPNFNIQVNVSFTEKPNIEVLAILKKITKQNKNITVTII